MTRRNFFPLLLMVIAVPSLCAERAKAINLTIEDYVKRVMSMGDEAITLLNNYENASLNYRASYRQSRFPSATLTSSVGKDKSDVNENITRTEQASGSASLSQPFYLTGAQLSAGVTQNFRLSKSSHTFETRSFTRPEYNFSLTQPLYLFSGNTVWRSWTRSQISYDIARDNYQRDVQQLEMRARTAYFNVILKREELDVERIKLESSKRSLEVTRALVNAGRLAGIELSRSQINMQRDVRRLQNAETAFQQTVNDALRLAAMSIDSPVKFVSELKYKKYETSVDKLVQFALTHRPDYLAAERQLKLSKLNVRETLEGNNPKLDAVFSYSKSDSGIDSYLTESQVWTGGVDLNWAFFDSRVTHLQAEAAKNSLNNDEISLKNLERVIRTEVANAYLELKRTEEQLEDLRLSKDQVRQSVDAVRIRYQNGRDRLIDVFDSEQELRDIEREYLAVIVTANLAKDRLALSIGGRLEDLEP